MEKPAKNDPHSWPAAAAGSAVEERRAVFAAKLRAAREAKGLTAPALAQATRINLNFLEALESGAFDRLPGLVFAHGFIRAFAKHLATDAAPLIEAFDAAWDRAPARTVLTVEIKNKPTRQHSETLVSLVTVGRSAMGRGRAIKAVVAAAVVAGVFYVASGAPLPQSGPGLKVLHSVARHLRGGAASVATAPAKAKPVVHHETVVAAAPTTSKTDKSEAPAATTTAVGKPANTDEKAAPVISGAPNAAQNLELQVTEPVRIRLEMDGQQISKELALGTYQFGFNQKAEMLVYDAAAVKISFNGRPLGPLGNKGRVRRLSFQAHAPEPKAR